MESSPIFELSSGNVYADLGRPNADEMFLKAQLVMQIQSIIEQRGLAGLELEQVVQMPLPQLQRVLRGHFSEISEGQLFIMLNRLGHAIEIRISPEATEDAHTMLAAA